MTDITTPFPDTPHKLGLYPVLNSVEWIARLLDAGVTTLQLRIKDLPSKQVEENTAAAIALGKQYRARLFINDYWQLAIKHRAYGIHLGQEDLDSADLLAIHRAGLRLGVSTHDNTELTRAIALKPSYIALGHIFATQTKNMPSAPQGLSALKRYIARLPGYSTVAIGGITLDRVPAVLACGVGSVAVVTAITKAPDWRAATAKLLQLIEGEVCSDA